MGLDLSPGQTDQLIAYLALLSRWNTVYNLTALRDPDQMLAGHVLDALAAIAPLSKRLELSRARIADVGSGGGIPGLMLAVLFPEAPITLIEPVGKKAAFLRQCAAELGLSAVRVAEARAETLSGIQDVVICRAFASIADFVKVTAGLCDDHTLRVAMKGQWPESELAELAERATHGPASPNSPGSDCKDPVGLEAVDRLRVEVLELVVPELDARRHLVLLHGPRRSAAQAAAPAQAATAAPVPEHPPVPRLTAGT